MAVAEDERIETETFATYLARVYVTQKGFRSGTVPEAHALLDAADFVLTRADGMSFQILCFVDREAHPEKRFTLEKNELAAIGTACLIYTGSMSGAKLPVSIQVFEISNAPADAGDVARLKPLRQYPRPFSKKRKVAISAWFLDTSEGTVWSNAAFGGVLRGARGLRKLMLEPRRTFFEAERVEAVQQLRKPFLTYALLALLAAIFACEIIFPVEPPNGFLDPGVHTLTALGALDRNAIVEQGEWWRLLSAPLLHGGALHILFNGFALFLAGMILERIIGHAWFAAIFAVSAVCGSAMSLAVNPANVVSVGASGAIMGLFAATLVAAHRFAKGSRIRTAMQMGSLQVLIPSMLPLWGAVSGQRVDFGAHIGGALGGVVMGFILLAVWPGNQALPSFRKFAAVIGIAGLAAAGFAFVAIAREYQTNSLAEVLIPAEELGDDSEVKARSAEFVARYPNDPRSHLFQAMASLDRGDRDGAERSLYAALGKAKILKAFFKPDFEARLRTLLSLQLNGRGKIGEAKAVAEPICTSNSNYRHTVVTLHLCQ